MENSRIKVLSIDNNQDNLGTLKAQIKETFPDALYITAINGERGLELANTENPDVILLDAVMSVMDGFYVCKKLKSDSKLRVIPVVYITAQKGDKESRIRAMEVGAEAFIARPIDEIELTAQIRAMVKIKRAEIAKINEEEHLHKLVEEKTHEQKKAYIATLNLLEDLKREYDARMKNEEELRKSEERFRSLIENAFDGIYLTNGKYFYYVNSKFCELLGYTAQELTSPDFNFDSTLTKESKKFVNGRTQLRKQGQEIPGTYEFKLKTKDGNYKNVEVSTVNLNFGDDINEIGIVRDISERKKMELQMIHSERLSALGEMSAGIAHEINQPLTTLSLTFDNILFEARESNQPKRKYLDSKVDKIFENIERIRNIIDHIRAFSRNQEEYILAAFNINDGINNALSMISVQYKTIGINLLIQLEEEIPSVIGNIFKFEQVILNLLSNAKDALLEKKNVLIKDYPMHIGIRTFTDNQHITIEVDDNGVGIKSQDMDKVLKPFYTTKETGKGTGLGLSISYGLIKEMKGKIEIRSEHLQGTTFLVKLPLPE